MLSVVEYFLVELRVEGELPVARVDRHAKSFRVGLEHGNLAGTEALAVLVHVVLCDDKQRLFVGPGVGVGRTRAVPLDAWGQADYLAGPLGQQAIFTAGLDAPDRVEILAESGDILRRHLGHCSACDQ